MTERDLKFHLLNCQFNRLIQLRDELRQDLYADDSLFRFLDSVEQDLRRQLSQLTACDERLQHCR